MRGRGPAAERSGPHAHQTPLMAGCGARQNMVEGVAQQFSVVRRLHKKTLPAGGAARECRVALALNP
jgi:hypothetical protein